MNESHQTETLSERPLNHAKLIDDYGLDYEDQPDGATYAMREADDELKTSPIYFLDTILNLVALEEKK
jgi:hypothetical protein